MAHSMYCKDNAEYRKTLGERVRVIFEKAGGLETDVADIKTDVAGLETDVADIKTDVAGIEAILSTIENLSAENIKVGVTILGVTGTFTADADATAADIANGKTAYVNGVKITGTV